jgi:hypothetical protein
MWACQFRYCIDANRNGTHDPDDFSGENYAGIGTIINNAINQKTNEDPEWAVDRTEEMNDWAKQ